MSDFVTDFWHYFVAAAVMVSVLACLALLWISGTTKANTHDDNTTGHVWDENIKELNNPLPKWWVYLFIITVIFALVYGFLYPTFGRFAGQLNWSSQGQLEAERVKHDNRFAPMFADFANKTPEQLAADPKAMAIGGRLFQGQCAQCHGSDARGAKGFPNLADKDWLYGGDVDTIRQSIEKGRTGVMPPMAATVGAADDVRNVAHYVLSLSGSPHDSLRASLGKPKFVACAACHGADGKGNPAVGAPNLTDDIWLHGWGEEAIVRAMGQGFNNHMPPQAATLSEGQVKILATYVSQLSKK